MLIPGRRWCPRPYLGHSLSGNSGGGGFRLHGKQNPLCGRVAPHKSWQVVWTLYLCCSSLTCWGPRSDGLTSQWAWGSPSSHSRFPLGRAKG